MNDYDYSPMIAGDDEFSAFFPGYDDSPRMDPRLERDLYTCSEEYDEDGAGAFYDEIDRIEDAAALKDLKNLPF